MNRLWVTEQAVGSCVPYLLSHLHVGEEDLHVKADMQHFLHFLTRRIFIHTFSHAVSSSTCSWLAGNCA